VPLLNEDLGVLFIVLLAVDDGLHTVVDGLGDESLVGYLQVNESFFDSFLDWLDLLSEAFELLLQVLVTCLLSPCEFIQVLHSQKVLFVL